MPNISPDGAMDHPVWRLGRIDGSLGQPAKDGEELLQAIYTLYDLNAKSYKYVDENYFNLREKYKKSRMRTSAGLGMVFLIIWLGLLLAEFALSWNFVEIAFKIDEPPFNWFLAIGISLIGTFSKFIWDALTPKPKNQK
ncbi:MAG: hypothetical protein ONB42_15980 [candidate division KSB1 bacterium]|nr:hypothetical protein [candidate division KSB1 bacterium]